MTKTSNRIEREEKMETSIGAAKIEHENVSFMELTNIVKEQEVQIRMLWTFIKRRLQ